MTSLTAAFSGADPLLERSHRCAAILARRSGSNFYRSFSLLPRDKRRAMTALYAFARRTDDFGDSIGTAAERVRNLKAWRTATMRSLDSERRFAWDGVGFHASGDATMPAAVRAAAADLLPALADAAERYAIPSRHLLEIVEGVLLDQSQTRYQTFEDVERYSSLVASAVGLACVHIWRYGSAFPEAAAVDCGIAFQWTNILRDIREDAARGRIYLPIECWGPRGLSEADFQTSKPSAAMLEVCREIADRASQQYERGWKIYEYLHPDGRRMFSMIWRSYRSLLNRIEADPVAVFRHRVELRHRDRLRIIGSHVVGLLSRHLNLATHSAGGRPE